MQRIFVKFFLKMALICQKIDFSLLNPHISTTGSTADSQNVKEFLKLLLSYFFYSQIWLDFTVDDR